MSLPSCLLHLLSCLLVYLATILFFFLKKKTLAFIKPQQTSHTAANAMTKPFSLAQFLPSTFSAHGGKDLISIFWTQLSHHLLCQKLKHFFFLITASRLGKGGFRGRGRRRRRLSGRKWWRWWWRRRRWSLQLSWWRWWRRGRGRGRGLWSSARCRPVVAVVPCQAHRLINWAQLVGIGWLINQLLCVVHRFCQSGHLHHNSFFLLLLLLLLLLWNVDTLMLLWLLFRRKSRVVGWPQKSTHRQKKTCFCWNSKTTTMLLRTRFTKFIYVI